MWTPVTAPAAVSIVRTAQPSMTRTPARLAARASAGTAANGSPRPSLGVTTHANEPAVIRAATESGFWDVVVTAYNFRQSHREEIRDAIREAARSGVGVVAMKTLAGAKDSDFDSKGAPFAPAAFKWVLSHPEVNGLVITIKTIKDLDLYLTASGARSRWRRPAR